MDGRRKQPALTETPGRDVRDADGFGQMRRTNDRRGRIVTPCGPRWLSGLEGLRLLMQATVGSGTHEK